MENEELKVAEAPVSTEVEATEEATEEVAEDVATAPAEEV